MLNYERISVVDYWKQFNVNENDLVCKECGKPLIEDIEYLKNNVQIYLSDKNKYVFIDVPLKKTYVESEHDRWAVKGRTLSGKTFFRRICWDCFFKHVRESIDVKRKGRYGKWYGKICNGDNVIPSASTSPNPTFKWLFDITDEELEKERQKFDTASKESFIRRFGEKEGLEKFQKYCDRQSYTCSKEYMQKTRGYTDEQWKQFNANRASTKENYIKRYGEVDGLKRWNEYCSYESYAGNSLQYFRDKYGYDKGLDKYNEVCSKKEFKFRTYSDVSQQLFKNIDDKYLPAKQNSRWEIKNHEFELYLDIDGVKYFSKVDFFFDGKIIEFNGDIWHANPQKFKANDKLSFKNDFMKTAQDAWDYDARRIAALEKLGYKVKVVWELDYKLDSSKVVDECIQFLKS